MKPYEVEDLRKNLPLLKVEATNRVKSDIEGFKPAELNWRWFSSPLERIEETGSNQ